MANAEIHTQGTNLYVVDTTVEPPKIAKIDCPSSISGIGGGTKNKIKTTRLSDTGNNRYMSGLGDPSTVSIPYFFETSANNHKLFEALKGKTVSWLICMSDGKGDPTLEANGEIKPPATRSGVMFEGFIDENTIEFDEDNAVKGTLSIQVSGNTSYTYKA